MSSDWTPELVTEALRLLNKIRDDIKERRLPRAVYEAHARTYKKISTELALFNEQGQIWLIQRKAKEVNPDDSYAGEWHLPGVMHNLQETTSMAYARLMSQELGEVVLKKCGEVVPLETDDGRRGLFYALLHVCTLTAGTLIDEGNAAFFDPTSLPSPMVPFHKDLLVPEAVKIFNANN